MRPPRKSLERQFLVLVKLYLPQLLFVTFYIWVVLGFIFLDFFHHSECCLSPPLSSSFPYELLKALGFGC